MNWRLQDNLHFWIKKFICKLRFVRDDYITFSQPVELLNNAFASDKLKHRAPNMIKISTRFNRLSKWISTTILKEESLRFGVYRILTFSTEDVKI